MEATTITKAIKMAQCWREEGKSLDEVQLELSNTGMSTEEVDLAMKEIKGYHYAEQRRKGIPLIGIGAILCVLGCVVTLLTTDSGGAGFHFALYGMTGIGATTIMGGLALVFG